jgi:hypothetical protein
MRGRMSWILPIICCAQTPTVIIAVWTLRYTITRVEASAADLVHYPSSIDANIPIPQAVAVASSHTSGPRGGWMTNHNNDINSKLTNVNLTIQAPPSHHGDGDEDTNNANNSSNNNSTPQSKSKVSTPLSHDSQSGDANSSTPLGSTTTSLPIVLIRDGSRRQLTVPTKLPTGSTPSSRVPATSSLVVVGQSSSNAVVIGVESSPLSPPSPLQSGSQFLMNVVSGAMSLINATPTSVAVPNTDINTNNYNNDHNDNGDPLVVEPSLHTQVTDDPHVTPVMMTPHEAEVIIPSMVTVTGEGHSNMVLVAAPSSAGGSSRATSPGGNMTTNTNTTFTSMDNDNPTPTNYTINTPIMQAVDENDDIATFHA